MTIISLRRNKVLAISDGIENMGIVKWDLCLCLLFAWIVVYLCICKGIKSSGKVRVCVRACVTRCLYMGEWCLAAWV